MIILLNGPLGVGKSTLSEALCESLDSCAMLDGDHFAAVNPAPENALEHLHAGLVLLMEHHWRFGYRNFVVNHVWLSVEELADFTRRIKFPELPLFCYRLTLERRINLSRIAARARVRALDESEFERQAFDRESELLDRAVGDTLGVPFDVSAPPTQLVQSLLAHLEMCAGGRAGVDALGRSASGACT